jgi:sialidase-1
MNLYLNILISILLTVSTGQVHGQVTSDSTYFHEVGSGFRNSQIRFVRAKVGTVAFLGGSITQNGGWRDSICSYLQARFPDTKFNFLPAGISSMGTTPGAFRLERDVLSKGPIDLLFEEAAVNDATNGRSSKEQIRGMEGIIRHALTDNPATDIVVMHFVDPDKIAQYSRGDIPEVIRNFEQVTNHYQVGCINLAKEVSLRINKGEFTWEDDFKDVHPSPFGQSVYFRSMKVFLEDAYGKAPGKKDKIRAHPVPEPLDPFCYENGRILPIQQASIVSEFEHVPSWSPEEKAATRKGYTQVDMLVGKQPGAHLTLPFEGRAVGIMVAAGPDAGVIEYSIDGSEVRSVDLFTSWSQHLYLPWYYTLESELKEGKHLLELRISDRNNPESTGHSCIIKAFYINK